MENRIDWRLALELIGAIGVIFNIFIDWSKFVNRIKEFQRAKDSNRPPLVSRETKFQTLVFPKVALAVFLWIILIISLINYLDSFTSRQLSYFFLILIVAFFTSFLLIQKLSWFNNLLISVGIVLVYFNAYSLFNAPGWVGFSLPLSGDQGDSLYIEYYKFRDEHSYNCGYYNVLVQYVGQSSSHIRIDYDDTSFSLVGTDCEPISNEWELTPAFDHDWFWLIPKFEGESQNATKIYLVNLLDNSLILNEPIEIFINNSFYSNISQIFPFYFIAVFFIYLIGKKRKTA